MNEEDAKLLFSEVLARMPYGTIYEVIDHNDPDYHVRGSVYRIEECNLSCIEGVPYLFYVENVSTPVDISEIKPYLRSMMSMTLDECAELDALVVGTSSYFDRALRERKFFIRHQIDYNSLSAKGLSLEAPKDMYNFD